MSGWLADVWGRKNTLTLASMLLLGFGLTFNLLLDPETAKKLGPDARRWKNLPSFVMSVNTVKEVSMHAVTIYL